MSLDNYVPVSVVMPFYNAGKTVALALNSVISQDRLPREIIVVDDASDEANLLDLNLAVEALRAKVTRNVDVKVFSLAVNKGAAYARNYAISNSTQKYIAFLDSDDVWCNSKLRIQYEHMEVFGVCMSGHGYLFNLNDEHFNEGDANGEVSFRNVKLINFIYTNPFYTPTVMVRRIGFKLFDPNFRRVDDYKCWLENMSAGRVTLLGLDLAGGFKYPIGAGGLTASVSKMHKSYIAVLNSLYRSGDISMWFFLASVAVEHVKYPMRYFRNMLRIL